MTLEEMASAVRNNVGAGLNETADYIYSLEQIYDDLNNAWNTIVENYTKLPDKTTLDNLALPIEIEPELYDMPYNFNMGYTGVFHTKIPKVVAIQGSNPVRFFGPKDMGESYVVYTNPEQVKNHKYKRVTKDRPFGYIDLARMSENQNDFYIFNLEQLPSMKMHVIISDPVKYLESQSLFSRGIEFPAPRSMQALMIKTVTEDYIRYYRGLNPGAQPDTKTDNS